MPTVMLVDDEELSRFALRTLLSRNFADMTVVAEAETGEEAVEKYARYRPDGVLMDIRIPGINGLEASRRILSEYPKASILICSAYDSFSLVSEALDIGVKGYLLKPVKREEAVAKISRLFHARVSATEAFADQQVLALLTANALSGETRAQITRYYGRLDDGVLIAASCPGAAEEQLGRLGYLLKKRAPSLGYVFTGALEGLFAGARLARGRPFRLGKALERRAGRGGVRGRAPAGRIRHRRRVGGRLERHGARVDGRGHRRQGAEPSGQH